MSKFENPAKALYAIYYYNNDVRHMFQAAKELMKYMSKDMLKMFDYLLKLYNSMDRKEFEAA